MIRYFIGVPYSQLGSFQTYVPCKCHNKFSSDNNYYVEFSTDSDDKNDFNARVVNVYIQCNSCKNKKKFNLDPIRSKIYEKELPFVKR